MAKNAFLILTLHLLSLSLKAQLNAEEIFKMNSPYVVSLSVNTEDNKSLSGTGFYMKDLNAIVTNYHVIQKYSSIKIKLPNNSIYNGSLTVDIDPTNDVALLRLDPNSIFNDGLTLYKRKYGVGGKVFVIGNPMGLDFSVTEGIISSVRSSEKM